MDVWTDVDAWTKYRDRAVGAFVAMHTDDDADYAVELLKDLTADQRTEIAVTLQNLGDALDRARRESGDI